jgi:hypothetical protein
VPLTLYMVVEHFKHGDSHAVYERFLSHGRMMPEGLEYISSWTTDDLTKCFQLVKTADISLINQWISNWSDLVDFEFYPVISSSDAVSKFDEIRRLD